ncbi:MAG: hypothetical protein ISS66_04665 [Desulfobacteraceae bacterium]|nr:hypothetical protein [Desulfobacteraceae bacterium]
MKLTEAMKMIDDGWVRRLKGFRVHFQRREGSQWVTDYFPDEKAKPITSDISMWELARRFAETVESDSPEPKEGDIVNIYVVDDLGNPVKFYATNKPHILNYREIEKD